MIIRTKSRHSQNTTHMNTYQPLICGLKHHIHTSHITPSYISHYTHLTSHISYLLSHISHPTTSPSHLTSHTSHHHTSHRKTHAKLQSLLSPLHNLTTPPPYQPTRQPNPTHHPYQTPYFHQNPYSPPKKKPPYTIP